MKKIPNLMSEIIAFVTKNFTSIKFVKLSDAEKLIAFPELPDSTEIDSLTFSLISIFFGTPIGWTRLDPTGVRKLYRHNLDVIIKGVRKNK